MLATCIMRKNDHLPRYRDWPPVCTQFDKSLAKLIVNSVLVSRLAKFVRRNDFRAPPANAAITIVMRSTLDIARNESMWLPRYPGIPLGSASRAIVLFPSNSLGATKLEGRSAFDWAEHLMLLPLMKTNIVRSDQLHRCTEGKELIMAYLESPDPWIAWSWHLSNRIVQGGLCITRVPFSPTYW